MRVLVFCLAAASLSAQSFEVASVKPNHTGNRNGNFPRLRNGTFETTNVSLKTLLFVAYGFSDLRITGPDWLGTDKFDITAKAPEGIPDSQIMPLLQSLLKDRFHAETHFETRELAAYDLVVDKGGAKLTPFDPAHPPVSGPNLGGSLLIGVGTTAQIADMVAREAGRPVVDKTEIEGRFAYKISFSPVTTDAPGANDSGPPDIFTAVRQQLGLKLEPKKESIQFLVVDHAERVPSEN